jgi:hypothetical protein
MVLYISMYLFPFSQRAAFLLLKSSNRKANLTTVCKCGKQLLPYWAICSVFYLVLEDGDENKARVKKECGERHKPPLRPH